MRKFLTACMLALTVLCSLAAVPSRPNGPIYDPDDIIRAEQQIQLEQKLNEYRERSGHAIVIAIVPGLNKHATIEQYATDIFHTWGIGDVDRDDGILVLWDYTDRKVRIEVGYGLEGQLPDGRAGQILREEILPRFKDGQFAEGLFVGVDNIITQLDYREDPKPTPAQQETDAKSVLPWILVGIVALIGLIVGLLYYLNTIKEDQKYQEEIDRLYAQTRTRVEHQTSSVKKPTVVAAQRSKKKAIRSEPDFGSVSSVSSTRRRQDDSSSWSSSSSDWGSSSFGGGDSGGGGASGDY